MPEVHPNPNTWQACTAPATTGSSPPDGTESWIVCHANDSASGGNNQKWRLEDQADDTSRLVNVASGKVLDVAGCAGADGTDIRQWSWLNNTCQQWSLSPVS